MNPVDIVLDRLASYRVHPNGNDRWRACCPAHGGKNRSALSVGIGAEGQVLIKCWHGCSVDEVAGALGLDLEDLFPPKGSSGGRPTRRRLITASQALEVLENEMTLAIVVASDLARGHAPSQATRERLVQAAARVALIRDEANA